MARVANPWRVGWGVSAAILFVAALACEGIGAPSTSPSPSAAVADQTGTPGPDFNAGVILEEFPPGGPRNEVRLENREDGRFKARASIKMHRIPNDDVDPVNIAFAQATCTNCQTIAVAVQVVLYKRGAHNVSPQNIAVAANVRCTRCVTIARAMQWVIPVDDLNAVPHDVDGLVKDMDKELRFLASINSIEQMSSDEANSHIQNVLNQYAQLQQYLLDMTQRQTADNATPAPSAGTSPTGSSSPAPASATPSAMPTAAPTATP